MRQDLANIAHDDGIGRGGDEVFDRAFRDGRKRLQRLADIVHVRQQRLRRAACIDQANPAGAIRGIPQPDGACALLAGHIEAGNAGKGGGGNLEVCDGLCLAIRESERRGCER